MDVYPRHAQERSDAIDGSIGEGSAFHELYGYYAQGVGPKTATLPRGWERRLIRVLNPNTNGVTGLCLEVHDLAISKYVAGRQKDLEFTRELASHQITRKLILSARLRATKINKTISALVTARIARDF